VSERIRSAVERHSFDIGQDRIIRMTCSIGVAIFPFHQEAPLSFGWHKVVDIADMCLYAAKRSGRNAWVGLVSTQHSTIEDFSANITKQIPELLSQGVLEVHASLEDLSKLTWE
jgi:predicted signal transduction protein with EAL and GGDEF domain